MGTLKLDGSNHGFSVVPHSVTVGSIALKNNNAGSLDNEQIKNPNHKLIKPCNDSRIVRSGNFTKARFGQFITSISCNRSISQS